MCQKVRFYFEITMIAVREVVQDLCHHAHAIYNNNEQIQATKWIILGHHFLLTENHQNYTTINNQ